LISKDQQTTTADPILTLTTISSTNNEFSIAIIATQEGLINEFNQHYAQELILYSTSNWCSWLIKQWLIEIISQIH
jgi:hypothetical protein